MFPILINGIYELLVVVGIIFINGIAFYFLLPNVVELSTEDDMIVIRDRSKKITEPIANIYDLSETYSFLNQSYSKWAFYRLTLKEANELGNQFFFLTKKSSIHGVGNKKAIGELNYKIALERRKTIP